MTRIRPARPFPPHGRETEGIIDLGVRLRDTLFRRDHVERTVRAALADRLGAALQEQRHVQAASMLQAFVDTWPAAAAVDDARDTWTEGPDGAALAVLHRVAVLTGLATGGRPDWPSPGPEWVRKLIGNRLVTAVEQRHPADGAERLAEHHDVQVVQGPALPLPPVRLIGADQLVELRVELGRALATGELAAVAIQGEVPSDPQAQLAAWELRLEGDAQQAVARYGLMGAAVPGAPSWDEVLTTAPAQGLPARPRAHARLLKLPGTVTGLAQGQVQPTAWLVWDAPHRPVPVTGAAAAVLSRLDGSRTLDQVAEDLDAPPDAVHAVADALADIGAAGG